MASQTPVQGNRAAPSLPAPGFKKAGMSPLPAQQRRKGRSLKWVLIIPLLLLGVIYLLGRTVEPVRVRLVPMPLAGKLLFAKPVWPILWNKNRAPATSPSAPGASKTEAPSTAPPAASAPDNSQLEAEVVARLAAVEVKENELKRREAEFTAMEAALMEREGTIAQQEIQLGQEIKAAQVLRAQLEGQRRSETDRAEVIRNMRTAGVQQLFGAMTDEEVLRVLMYMDATEVGKYLSGMDAYRSARLLQALRQVAPPTSNIP